MEITLFRKISSSLFQYFERTITSSETNDISAESSGFQFFGARRTRTWQYHGGAMPIWRTKHFFVNFYGRVEGF